MAKRTYPHRPDYATPPGYLLEEYADEWAADFLIARSDWNDFISGGHFSEWAVRSFANRQGIAPAIVVGRLQRERLIPWSRLNYLKARMRWRE